jgi:glycosyltransferase involved in cell wall biosynthesis
MGFSSTWANSRKGTDVLVDALNILGDQNLGCIAWGGGIGTDWPENVPMRHFGSIHSDRLSALLYSACDFFVCPSRADNLPNTCIESLSCCTPILGSDAGGIPEMARLGETGWVYKNDDPESLANTFKMALSDQEKWPEYQSRSREVAVSEYDVSVTASRYAALYRDVLGLS